MSSIICGLSQAWVSQRVDSWLCISRSSVRAVRPEFSMGWVDPWVGLGWAGLGRGSETFPKILKRGRPLVTAEVIPDNLIMINTDKWVISDKLSLTIIYQNCLPYARRFVLLVVWSSIGLWVVGWLVCEFKVFTLRWVGLGWVEEIWPTDNSVLAWPSCSTVPAHCRAAWFVMEQIKVDVIDGVIIMQPGRLYVAH